MYYCTVESCLHEIFYDLNLGYDKIRCRYKWSLHKFRFLCKGNAPLPMVIGAIVGS